jgi:hypothetical protein
VTSWGRRARGAAQKTEKERRKERNRALQAAIQAEHAARRVRRVDALGVAHAVGRRKCSTAQARPPGAMQPCSVSCDV